MRPITLLNVDYKFLAKSLANRFFKVLPHIINEDQTSYTKRHFIGCNIRQIEDVIIYSELNHTPGISLTVDFEKAFDSISRNFIDKTLEAFNFSPVFRGCVKTLYKNISSVIINNIIIIIIIIIKVKSLKAEWVKRFLVLSSHRWNAAPISFYNTMDMHFSF